MSHKRREPGYPDRMGPRLHAEVERQLFKDFRWYTHEPSEHLAIDWSDSCGEGHATAYLDGWLENWSEVGVVNAQGQRIAYGWIDFIHGGGDNPLFVFWQYLHLAENTEDVVGGDGIPQHIWESLPERTKDLCLTSGAYDAAWCNDPLVLQWRNQRSQRDVEKPSRNEAQDNIDNEET